MFSLGSLGYMIGKMVVNCPLRNHGGILRALYLVCLVSLKSLVQILRAVTLTVHKVENGVISREWGHQGCLGHFQEGQGGHFQVQEAQEGHPGVFPRFQYCGPSSGEIC